jgi:hypothetical protein
MTSARAAFIGAKLRKLLSPAALIKAATNPRVVLNTARQALFDVALRKDRPAESLEMFQRSVLALAEFTAPLPVLDAANILGGAVMDPDCMALDELFCRHGSDKSTTHDYHLVYAHLLRGKRASPLRILEVGVGSNNIDVAANMGPEGRPGASLRAFRDWAPQAQVVGADVDRRILFSEERIETHFVDQTDPQSLANLAAKFSAQSFDLLIDDGLHTPEANLHFLRFALPLMKPDGAIVIEDVGYDAHPLWQAVAGLLPAYHLQFFKTKADCLVIVRHS